MVFGMIPRVVASKKNPRKRMASNNSGGNKTVTKALVRQIVHSIVDSESEDKFWDTLNGTSADIDWTGPAPLALSDVVQGSSDTTRVGDLLRVKRVSWSIFLRYNQTNTTTNLSLTGNVVRIVIFAWKPFFGDVAPTNAKIMTYTSTAYAAAGPFTHDGKNQFIVLMDTTVLLDGFSKASRLIKGSVKTNHEIQYKAGSTTNAAGGIYWLCMSDAVASSGLYPSVKWSSFRIDYQDA